VHDLDRHPELRSAVDEAVDYEYEGTVAVRSLLDVVVNRVGLDAVSEKVVKDLDGLKVVSYYGCLLTRPPEITGAADPEYPMEMDRLVESLGAESLDWSYKTSCCGASLSVTNTEIALQLSRKILENAQAVGADAVVVACPLCHTNLDARQHQMGMDSPIPILYFTQLMAVAFGLDDKAAALKKNAVDPRPLISEKVAAGG
jgi:heterodisulfide reductase subunit B